MDLSRVDVLDFLQALGVRVESRSGDNALFLCPFHTERHPSARMSVKTTQWLCSVGCGKGNAISFLAMLRDMDFEDAKIHIANRYGIGPTAPIDDLESEVRRNLLNDGEEDIARVPPDERWIETFAINWEADPEHRAVQYMINRRGFDPRVLAEWEVGFDDISGRVTIPVRDVEGRFVGFKARALEDDTHPRYLILGSAPGYPSRYDFHTYRKSEHVYGLYRVVRGRHAVIVEGELNVVAMWQRGFDAAVAVAGSEFSETQRRLIVERCGSATIFFDGDEAGIKGASKVAAMLQEYIPVVAVMGVQHDAAELEQDEIREALLGAQPALALMARGDLPVVSST